MSLDRPFVLCGWAPDGQPIKPKHYRDPETAGYVARLLRESGYRIALIPAAPGGRERSDDLPGFAPGLDRFAPDPGRGAAAAPLSARQA